MPQELSSEPELLIPRPTSRVGRDAGKIDLTEDTYIEEQFTTMEDFTINDELKGMSLTIDDGRWMSSQRSALDVPETRLPPCRWPEAQAASPVSRMPFEGLSFGRSRHG